MKRAIDIAGGGISGLSLGLALRREGVPVRLHEAGAYPRHRLCGEFISGAGPGEFDRLGVGSLLKEGEILRDAVWFQGDRELLRRDLPEPALGISRWKLDATLARRFIDVGGELTTNERVGIPAADEGWVNATGRARNEASSWIGQKSHYQNLPILAGLEMHLGQGGYAGIARVEQGTANVCALLPATLGKQGSAATLPERLKACGLHALAERLQAATPVEASRCGVSHFVTGWQPSRAGSLSIGDHSAIIPPFTGNGMSMAMLGALEAAAPLANWAGGKLGWIEAVQAAREALRRKFSPRLRWAAWLHPLLLHPGGQNCVALMARSGLLPWNWLYHRVR